MGFPRVAAVSFAAFFIVLTGNIRGQATGPTTFTLNEDGTATAVTAGLGGGTLNYTGVNQQDPGPGGLPNALVFTVGSSPLLTPGDLS